MVINLKSNFHCLAIIVFVNSIIGPNDLYKQSVTYSPVYTHKTNTCIELLVNKFGPIISLVYMIYESEPR